MIRKLLGAVTFSVVLLTSCDLPEPLTHEEIKANAEANLDAYAKRLGEDYQAVGCSDDDSDGNGYVSCEIKKAKENQLLGYECGYVPGRTGCRKSAMKVDQQETETESYR
jgi:hypothetical protein